LLVEASHAVKNTPHPATSLVHLDYHALLEYTFPMQRTVRLELAVLTEQETQFPRAVGWLYRRLQLGPAKDTCANRVK